MLFLIVMSVVAFVVWAIGAAYFGTRNRMVLNARCKELIGHRHHDDFCALSFFGWSGYLLWFIVCPCVQIALKTESNAGTSRASRKEQKQIAQLESAQRIKRKQHEVDMENARLLEEAAAARSKSLQASGSELTL